MFSPFSFVHCPDYEAAHVNTAIEALPAPPCCLNWVIPGAVKVNLVDTYPPQSAVTTHPQIVCTLTENLCARGGQRHRRQQPGRSLQRCSTQPHL